MIANYTESGWQIITQRSHGLLAAQICGHWKKDDQPVRWVDTLIATAEHDDVYNEFENSELINELGGPINFKETEFELSKNKRLIDMAETKSAYIALLTSKHIAFVHGADPKAFAFIKELKTKEKTWLKTADATQKEIKLGYELLQFCDAFSLLICQELIQPEDRKIEISAGPNGQSYEMHTSGNKLIVTPWPFELDSFTVTYESRTLSNLKIKETHQFRKEIKQANVVTNVINIAKPK